MTDELDLEPIKARLAAIYDGRGHLSVGAAIGRLHDAAEDDIAALIAEVERLRHNVRTLDSMLARYAAMAPVPGRAVNADGEDRSTKGRTL